MTKTCPDFLMSINMEVVSLDMSFRDQVREFIPCHCHLTLGKKLVLSGHQSSSEKWGSYWYMPHTIVLRSKYVNIQKVSGTPASIFNIFHL